MKCVSNEKHVIRTNDSIADSMVDSGEWKYVPKSEWKKNNPCKRDFDTNEIIKPRAKKVLIKKKIDKLKKR